MQTQGHANGKKHRQRMCMSTVRIMSSSCCEIERKQHETVCQMTEIQRQGGKSEMLKVEESVVETELKMGNSR